MDEVERKIHNAKELFEVFNVSINMAVQSIKKLLNYHKGSISYNKTIQRVIKDESIKENEKMFVLNFYGYVKGLADIRAYQYEDINKESASYMIAEELIEKHLESFEEISKYLNVNNTHSEEINYIG